MNFIPLLQQASQGIEAFILPIALGLVFLVIYFFQIRPQKKEEQLKQERISNLKKGDKLITIGGIFGTVSSTKERTIILKVDDNCKIEISRNAIGHIFSPDEKKQNKSSNAQKVDFSNSGEK